MIEEERLTGLIIKTFYKVYNNLGYGFLERIYHNAMIIELAAEGLALETEKAVSVHYCGRLVGTFAADLVVENKVILELKATEQLREAHEAQLVNYLRATTVEVGLLLNFGKKPEFKRKFFSNSNKTLLSRENGNILQSLFSADPPESA